MQRVILPACQVANRFWLVGRTECPVHKRRGEEVAVARAAAAESHVLRSQRERT